MRVLKGALVALAVVTAAGAQPNEPPISDTRLTVHTLLREDVFAGFLDNDTVRPARAEKNIAQLMTLRPDQRANLLAWKGGIALNRAVLAHEAGKSDDFAQYFKEARDAFGEAGRLSSGNDGVDAITGGSYAVFGDRLPKEYRAAAWAQSYASYSALWKEQGPAIEKLPLHHRGEVLAGMAQSAQRTGHAEESALFVDRMLTMLPGTPFEKTAKQWKEDPASAATTSLTCKNCHASGRLAAKLASLDKK
jgi:hypothetical protein